MTRSERDASFWRFPAEWEPQSAVLVAWPHAGTDWAARLPSVEGLKGAAVTNPGSIGGAGVTLALQILDGKKPASQTVLVQPDIWDNVTDEGKAKLKGAADPSLSAEWPVSISIKDWTSYTKDQIVACKGPGE